MRHRPGSSCGALGHERVYFLRGGLADWVDEVLNPKRLSSASPDEIARFERIAALSRYFGGVPRVVEPSGRCSSTPGDVGRPTGTAAGRQRSHTWRAGRSSGRRTDPALIDRDCATEAPGMLMARVARRPEAFFDQLRRVEFARLDRQGHAYLDYTGAALYADSQVRAHTAVLRSGVFGNPHADHGASRLSTETIDRARERVLSFLDADPSTYTVCFTANATAAIKLVAESYPFGADRGLVLSADNHNSVNGIREYARQRRAPITYLPLESDLRLTHPAAALTRLSSAGAGLFAFPGQSNFSGIRHPLSLVRQARRLGFDVLLDAAALVPSHPLSLRACPADFVVLSFYKLFGYPTGVGALVARRDALRRLRRPWFAGGTVTIRIRDRRHAPPAAVARGIRGWHGELPGHRRPRAGVSGARARGDAAPLHPRVPLDRRCPGSADGNAAPRRCSADGAVWADRHGRSRRHHCVQRARSQRPVDPVFRGGAEGAASRHLAARRLLLQSRRVRACLRSVSRHDCVLPCGLGRSLYARTLCALHGSPCWRRASVGRSGHERGRHRSRP